MNVWDDKDFALLRALSRDVTQSAGALGRQLGLSQPATWRRIKRLQAAGVLAGRRVDLNIEALGFGVTVFLGVKLATRGQVSLEDFERAVTAIPEVQTVQHVLGRYDYRLRVVARDISDFQRVLRRRIMTVRGIGDALGQAYKAVEGDISGVTVSLGVAFNSTFVALVLSIVIMFALHQLQLSQERLVLNTQRYIDRHLLRHLSVPRG